MCTRCESAEPYAGLDLCPACEIATRLEVAAGLRRLAAYLSAWAAFEDWLRRREPAAV